MPINFTGAGPDEGPSAKPVGEAINWTGFWSKGRNELSNLREESEASHPKQRELLATYCSHGGS